MQRDIGTAAVAGAAVPTTASTAGTQVVPQVATVSQYRVEEPGGPAYVAPPPERGGGWVFVVALIALLAVLAGLLYLLAQNFNVFEDEGDPDVVQVDVPSVEDLDRTTARQQLEALGFVVVEEAEQVQDPAQVDRVIRQSPQGGIRADQGSTVTITVGSQNTFAMPNLAGSTPDAARNTLSGLGFTGEVRETEEASETVDAGEIIGTEPAAGTQVATSSTITLIVSSGPPLVPVPSCATLTESDCVNAVSAAGFTPEVVQQPDGDVEEGRVVRTEPAGATEAESGSIVRIIVSSGPGTTSVPPVVGLDEDAARGALDEAGFGVNVVDQPVQEGSADDGRVISQNPGGNTQAEPGSTVTIVVGRADVGD
jgi:serine/threonine-protein kinase